MASVMVLVAVHQQQQRQAVEAVEERAMSHNVDARLLQHFPRPPPSTRGFNNKFYTFSLPLMLLL